MVNSVSSSSSVHSFTPVDATTALSPTTGNQNQSKVIDQLKDYIKQLLAQMQPQSSPSPTSSPSSSPTGSASPSPLDDDESTDKAGKKHKHGHHQAHGMGAVHEASTAQPGGFGGFGAGKA